MVIHYFHSLCVSFEKAKAHAKLIVDSYAVLALPISLQRLKVIRERNPKIGNTVSRIEHHQFAQSDSRNTSKPSVLFDSPQLLGVLAFEINDHTLDVLIYDTFASKM